MTRNSHKACGIGMSVWAAWSTCAGAAEFGPYAVDLQADARVVAVDSPYQSSLHGGLGHLRYDEEHDGVRLGRLLANFNGPISETVRADITLSATGDNDQNVVDVTEGFVEWRPYPHSGLRWRTRVGAFYPPISLENRAVGWQSPYSISASALNTWIGEEIRAIGVEQSLAILGAPSGRDYNIGLVAGAFGWNDPAGVLLFQRGWAMHDRQTPLFGALPRPNTTFTNEPIEVFHEIDHRVGYYAGAEYKYANQHVLRALHYDNRGDPSIRSNTDSTWRTSFNSLGWRSELATDTTFIAQGIKGETGVGASDDGRGTSIIKYWSYFGLVSQQFGRHRFTARYDRMYTETERGPPTTSDQSAVGWTLAYLIDVDRSWQFAVEALEIRGSLAQRERIGQPAYGVERTIQLAARYSL